MKKVIIVLLITVLVAGFAFAELKSSSFTGYAGIDFGVNFDAKKWGFENYTFGQYKFSFEFDSAVVAIGADHKTDVWAELDAEASASIGLAPGAGENNLTPPADGKLAAKYSAKITKANIHVGEITFGILNAGTAVDFAKTYYKVAGKQVSVVAPKGTAPGFTVSYKDWKGGFGAEGKWDEDDSDLNTYKIFAHVETPTFKFAEEAVTVDAGVYAFLTDKNTFLANIDATTGAPKLYTNIGGAVKGAYKADKLSASLAADLQAIMIPETAVTEKETKFAFEVAANAKYDFVSLDVYLAPGALWDYADEDPLKLDAKLAANYTFNLNEDIALAVTGWVDARDTLVKALSLEIGSTQETTVDAFKIELSEVATLKNLANADVDTAVELTASEKVTYTAEKFIAYESVAATFDFSADEALKALVVKAGISSEAIVEGAKLALDYATLANKIAFKDSKGSVTASCTISF